MNFSTGCKEIEPAKPLFGAVCGLLLIFDLYLKGYSVVKILNELEARGIKSPTGKERWCKRSIDTMLSNEKYIGDVVVLKSYSSGFPDNKRMKNLNVDPMHPMFIAEQSHDAIIGREVFDALQAKKIRRGTLYRTLQVLTAAVKNTLRKNIQHIDWIF